MERHKAVELNGRRLRLARLFRGLTQSELAREVAASPALLSQAENGTRGLGGDLIEAVAYVLGFEPAFFFQRIEDEFREEECNFRRRRVTSERLIKRLVAQATLFGMVVRHLQAELDMPALSLPATPNGGSGEDVEDVAEACRRQWGLPDDAPIERMGRVLERAGIVLTRLHDEAAGVDAFSRFGPVSVVVLNPRQNPSRTLLDMAHELGHGVLHRGLRTGTPDTEREAERFGAAFLLPQSGFRREFWSAGRLAWDHMFELKQRWRTSVALIVRRASDLGILDPATYRRACKYMYAQGWARSEPGEPESEEPELFRLALETLKQDAGETSASLAAKLHWKLTTFEEVAGMGGALETPPRILSLDAFRQKRQAATQ